MFKHAVVVVATAAGAALIPPLSATAQPVPEKATIESGKVIQTSGPEGSVIVVRGTRSYPLKTDDLLFHGDRILTRRDGAVMLLLHDCERYLGSIASIVVDDGMCIDPGIDLASIQAGALAGAAIVSGGVSSAQRTLGVLARGGGAVAAVTLDSAAAVD